MASGTTGIEIMSWLGRRPIAHGGSFAVVLTLALSVAFAGSSSAGPGAAPEPAAPLASVALSGPPAEAPSDSDEPAVASPPPAVVTFALGANEESTREPIERWLIENWPDVAARFEPVEGEPPDIVVGYERPGAGMESIRRGATQWIALTHFASDVDDLRLDDLRAAFKGERSSWAELDGPNLPITPVLVAGGRALGAAALGIRPEQLGDVDVMSAGDFSVRAPDLARHPGLLLVAPLAPSDPLAQLGLAVQSRPLRGDLLPPQFLHSGLQFREQLRNRALDRGSGRGCDLTQGCCHRRRRLLP